VQVKTVELKKLVYTYLVHYADANPACRELALLAISSYQRDLVDSNQLIRALALRVLCSIRVREIVQIQILSVKKASSDSSAYVRKSAAHCVGKIFQTDPEVQPDLIEIVERLLGGACAGREKGIGAAACTSPVFFAMAPQINRRAFCRLLWQRSMRSAPLALTCCTR
jgi:HEAT repeat protein